MFCVQVEEYVGLYNSSCIIAEQIPVLGNWPCRGEATSWGQAIRATGAGEGVRNGQEQRLEQEFR